MTKPFDRAQTVFEELKVKGSNLVEEVRTAVSKGNAKRVTIKHKEKVLLEIPLSVGVGGAAAAVLLAPQLAAIGALVALLKDVTVVIEREAPADNTDLPTVPPLPPTA